MHAKIICAALVAVSFSIMGSSVMAMSVNEDTVKLAQTQAGFQRWVENFKARALARGIKPTTLSRAFRGVKLNQTVIDRDRFQPEFKKQIWDYMDVAVSDERVKNGRNAFFDNRRALVQIERKYGVDATIVTAVWGLESAYGARMGDLNIIEALSTLAYEGRRARFAEEQLLEALKIIQRGDISASKMLGSWAGAMGHTQFIPTSFQAYAVDFTGDGKRDVWNPRDPRDALGSTANYLAKFGWQSGRPWGVEVRLPAGFNYSAASTKNRQSVSVWNKAGVRQMNGKPLINHGKAAIFLPSGANGPAFAVYNNFYVIKRYNNADSYALAIGHLSDRIAGGPTIQRPWPRGEEGLDLKEKKELQRRLTRAGFDTQGDDGIIGPNTIEAIRAYQLSRGQKPDGFATKSHLKSLR